MTAADAGQTSIAALPTISLLTADPAAMAQVGASVSEMQEEGHTRFASPLMGLAAPLLGFATLMLGGFSRFGLWRQIGLAVGLLIAMQLLWTWGGGKAIQTAGAWPALYLAPVIGLLTALGLLWWGQQPRPLRRAVT